MITMDTDRLVDDYLRRLEAAAAHLQRSRRAELVAEIRQHIEAALGQEDAANEVAVRNVLERLGPPEEIVEAAEPEPEETPSPGRSLEVVALIAMLVPVIGWLVGMVLVFASEAWSRRDKFVGLALLLAVLILPAVAFVTGRDSGAESIVPLADTGTAGLEEEASTAPGVDEEGSTEAGIKVEGGPGAVEVYVIASVVGMPSALYLWWRLRRRPNALA